MSVVTESEILASCLKSRKAYDVAHDLIPIDDFTPMGMRVFSGIGRYYELDEDADKVDAGLLFKKLEPAFANKEHKKQLHECIEDAKGMEVSPANVISLALDMRRQSIGNRVAENALNNEHDLELLNEYIKVIEADSFDETLGDEYVDLGFDELLPTLDNKNKIKTHPKSFNERIDGGLVKGDALIVAARPEAGKTAFTITNMCGMAYNGHKVIYAGNEDVAHRVIVRCLSCLTGRSKADMMKDPKGTLELARERGYGNIIFAYPVFTIQHLKSLAKKHKPDVVFIDQIRNLKVKADNRTGQLEAAATAVRSLGAEMPCATVGITQIGESGEGKLYLTMTDIDSSKTGIPGACDIMVLIGNDQTFDANNSRMINLAKNKHTGQHEAFTVKLDKNLSRYYDAE